MSSRLRPFVGPLAVLFSATALLTGCGSSGPTAGPATQLGTQDAAFVIGSGNSSNAEIGAAQLAMQKSQNADILAFASEMVTDHTQENADLAAATQNDGPSAPPPGAVNPMQAAEAQKLASLSGTAFDAEYVNSEIMGHQLNLNNNYVPETSGGQNPTIVGYANKYMPQIQMHLTMVQGLKTKYGF